MFTKPELTSVQTTLYTSGNGMSVGRFFAGLRVAMEMTVA